MADDRVFQALSLLLTQAPVIRDTIYLVGGTALWDWWYSEKEAVSNKGGFLGEPRITTDIDLGIERLAVQLAGNPAALRRALEVGGWALRGATDFTWIHPDWPDITIEILSHHDGVISPGSGVWARGPESDPVLKACATLRRLDPIPLELCSHPNLAAHGLSRLTQFGLLAYKVIAIGNSLAEIERARVQFDKPKAWTSRLEKDCVDAALLLDQQVRLGITGFHARKDFSDHRETLAPSIALIRRSASSVNPTVHGKAVGSLGRAVAEWVAELTST